jgi:hypothetical protein
MRAREIVTEAPLTDRAMTALAQIKQAMNQPGEQVAQISVAPVPAAPGKDLATLQAEIQKLEKILAIANMIERIAERIGRTRLGMDPGIEADLDIIRAWPVPKTDAEMADMLSKYESTLEQFKRFLAYKKKVWKR